MSVVALLALLCFPLSAHAEDSSGVQYSDAIPKAEGENTPSHKQNPAKSSSTDGGGTAPDDSKGSKDSMDAGSGEQESSSKPEAGAGAGGSGNSGQGNPGGGSTGSERATAQHTGQSTTDAAPASSSDGGSSPLVPILIAVLALAAISVGFVMYKQRRGPSGGTASPKAS